ncbi:MAG: hypothetical protein M3004_07565 [Bacteroidota bacterium]|nr:hypothetical protein [Bacteroidota bacterium]
MPKTKSSDYKKYKIDIGNDRKLYRNIVLFIILVGIVAGLYFYLSTP